MEYAYYYSQNAVVFLTKEDAKIYFFNENVFDDFDCHEYLNEFLANECYSRADLLTMTEREKEEVLEDYRLWCFEEWVKEELTRVDVYEG